MSESDIDLRQPGSVCRLIWSPAIADVNNQLKRRHLHFQDGTLVGAQTWKRSELFSIFPFLPWRSDIPLSRYSGQSRPNAAVQGF